MAEGLGQQVEAKLAFFGFEEGGMVYAHAVLMANRAAKLDEGLARGRFHLPP